MIFLIIFLVGINPHTPVAQKSADEVVFRHFQGEGAEFFLNRTSLTPHQIFDAHLLETIDLRPSSKPSSRPSVTPSWKVRWIF